MFEVTASSLPRTALLNRYTKPSWKKPGEPYTDSFAVRIPRPVDITQFVFAFYTTRLFKLERIILKYIAARPSTDTEAELLAAGKIESFSAWNLEARTDDQVLMCDFRSRTRSWFMVERDESESSDVGTLLRFGSAVVPVVNPRTGGAEMGLGFKTLLGFHKLYSRALLRSASRRLWRTVD